MTIRARVIATLSTIAAVTALAAFSTSISVRRAQAEAELIATRSVPAGHAIAEIHEISKSNLVLVYQHVGSSEKPDQDAIQTELAANSQRQSARQDDLVRLMTGNDAFAGLYRTLEEVRASNGSVRGDVLKLSAAGKGREAYALARAKLDPITKEYGAAVAAIEQEINRQATAATTRAAAIARRGTAVAVIAGVVSAMLSIGLGVLLVRSINRALRGAATDLARVADEVTSAAGQVSTSSQSLAEGASEQAASLEETTASLNEMTSMSKRSTDSAHQANELAASARNAADSGAKQIVDMQRAMDGIKSSSDEVAKIVRTIDEIAFQTNILALNAAVEAARAGGAGAGFAVVADEVRTLAQRAAVAARESSGKIEAAIENSERGVAISKGLGEALALIVTKAHEVDRCIAEIAASSKEQLEGIQQLSQGVTQIDRVTQTNASGAEENAAAAEELNAQAGALQRCIQELRVLVDGASAAATAGSPARQLPLATARVARLRDRHPRASATGQLERAAGQVDFWESEEPVSSR